MFDRSADFSRISSVRPLYVSGIRHRAIIEVNEEGTEAAALTMAQFAMCAPQPGDEPFVFTADRPFIAAICDNRMSTILFLGVVRDPQ
jgi:serpin B